MTHTLPQTALAALDAAGCDAGHQLSIPSGEVERLQPTVEDMMEWLAGKTGMIVLLSLTPPGLLSERYSPWEVSAYKPGSSGVPANRRFGKDPLQALYALALAVGAVKEGTDA